MDTIYSIEKKLSLCHVVELQSEPGHVLPFSDHTEKHTHRDFTYVSHITHTFQQKRAARDAQRMGGWLTRRNTDQGDENEAGFEMQIAHCVPAQSRKSSQCFMQNT